MRTPMKLTRLVPLVAAAALLAGCSPTPGTAASVDGIGISHAEVDRMVQGCREGVGIEDPNLNGGLVARTFILSRLFDRAVEGVEDARGMITAVEDLTRQQAPALMADDDCADFAVLSMKTQLLGQVIQSEEQNQHVLDADVQLNPRYGTFDIATLDSAPSGSLSVDSQG